MADESRKRKLLDVVNESRMLDEKQKCEFNSFIASFHDVFILDEAE